MIFRWCLLCAFRGLAPPWGSIWIIQKEEATLRDQRFGAELGQGATIRKSSHGVSSEGQVTPNTRGKVGCWVHSAQGQIIDSMNWLHGGIPKILSRRLLKCMNPVFPVGQSRQKQPCFET